MSCFGRTFDDKHRDDDDGGVVELIPDGIAGWHSSASQLSALFAPVLVALVFA